jgi:hypothetical protein
MANGMAWSVMLFVFTTQGKRGFLLSLMGRRRNMPHRGHDKHLCFLKKMGYVETNLK